MKSFSLLLALSLPLTATTVYTDTVFSDGVWQPTILQQPAGSSFSALFSNVGDGIQQVTVSTGNSVAAGTTATVNVAHFRSDFLWNPATDGPLGTVKVSGSFRHTSSTGYFNDAQVPHFWRPVILQDGKTYSVLSSSLQPTANGAFQTLSWDFTSQSDWVNFEDITLKPDFSANGGQILFGYRFQNGVVCSGGTGFCSSATSIGAIDSIRFEISAAQDGSAVPEPSSYMLALAGLAVVALRRKR